MITTLPKNTPFVMRDRGSFTLWQVSADGTGYQGLHDPANKRDAFRFLRTGDDIYFCIWKGDQLIPKKKYTLRLGDVDHIPTGKKFMDCVKGQWKESNRPIVGHKFGPKCPVWLRKTYRAWFSAATSPKTTDEMADAMDSLAKMFRSMK